MVVNAVEITLADMVAAQTGRFTLAHWLRVGPTLLYLGVEVAPLSVEGAEPQPVVGGEAWIWGDDDFLRPTTRHGWIPTAVGQVFEDMGVASLTTWPAHRYGEAVFPDRATALKMLGQAARVGAEWTARRLRNPGAPL